MKVSQRGLTTVARTIARQFGLSVHLESSKTKTGMTDGRRNIWAGFGVGTEEDAKITMGVVIHEAMHGRLTDFEVKGRNALEQSLLNIIQDVWGEREFGKLYKGAPRYIEDALDGMVQRGVFTSPKGDEEVPSLLTGMLVDGLRSIYLGQKSLAPFYQERRKLLEEKLGANLTAKIWQAAAQVETCKGDQRALEIVREISGLIQAAAEDPEQFSQPETEPNDTQGEDHQGGQCSGTPEASDGKGSEQQPSDSTQGSSQAHTQPKNGPGHPSQGSNAQTGDAPPSIGQSAPGAEEIQKAAEAILSACEDEFGKTDLGDQMQQSLRSSGAGPVESAISEKIQVNAGYGALLRTGAKPLINRIGSRLVDLFDTKREDHIEYRSSGRRIEAKQLVKIPCGETRIFRRNNEQEGVSVAVEIVLDCSGSMASAIPEEEGSGKFISLMRAAQTTMFAIGETLDRADVPFGVTLFAHSVARLKGMHESWRKAQERVPELMHDGSTLTHSAILRATEEIVFSDEDKRLLIVVTDGLPSHSMQTIAECKELQRTGVDVTFVLINARPSDAIFSGFIEGLTHAGISYAVASTASQISNAVFKAVKDA